MTFLRGEQQHRRYQKREQKFANAMRRLFHVSPEKHVSSLSGYTKKP
jgi:hypothetical protein